MLGRRKRKCGSVVKSFFSMSSSRPSRGLKFCPETNDLLYPRENKESRKLEYFCKNCQHVEPAEPRDYCVYVSETTTYSSADKTLVVQDVVADPTLPRTRDTRCPICHHNEAVYLATNTEQGMTLYFNCVSCRWIDRNTRLSTILLLNKHLMSLCRHKWRDYV